MAYLLFTLLGLFVGTLGTLIGAGGGFILMPILLFLYPDQRVEVLTSISLAVIFLNATSGSIAYARKRRIHYRSAILFSVAAAPGAIAGAFVTSLIPRNRFEFAFGLAIISIAAFLLIRQSLPARPRPSPTARSHSVHIDADGVEHLISYNAPLAALLSSLVGFISSLLGIGGGIIHVPALVHLLHFPVHIATATSHLVLAITALLGVAEHILRGDLNSSSWLQIASLAPGVIVGAQLGARLSQRMHGRWILTALALALMSVGLRLLFK